MLWALHPANTTRRSPPLPLTLHVDKFWGARERTYISMPGMRGQHGNGYQCCQDCERKLLHAGHFAPIEHTNCFSSHPPPPPSPNPPHHDSDSSSHSCFTNCHTRFATTLQSLPQDSVFTSTHLPPIINPVSPSYLVPYFPALSQNPTAQNPSTLLNFLPL